MNISYLGAYIVPELDRTSSRAARGVILSVDPVRGHSELEEVLFTYLVLAADVPFDVA